MEETRYSKRLRTGTRRRYQDDGISDDEIEGKTTFDLDEKLESSYFNSDLVKIMDGKDFTFEYIQREGLRDPIIFTKADGLGIQMPDSDFSVSDVKLFVGSRRMIDVMDVSTQRAMEMSMSQWRRYYETPASEREKLYNVISLEFSHTKLEHLVKRPASVDLIDWVDNMWPRHLKERQRDSTNVITDMQYPKVQKYCLMSVKGCFTDFHVDFGGTSVWYHILRGRKVFWLIPPTPHNLELYENWVLSGKQGDIFLGDKATACQRIELKQGYTFMIPSGWIHAVYTPEDTLVFGGNFLHSFNIPMQLNIYSVEDRTRVPAKFRYPFYYEMCWYVLERYLYCLTNISHLTPEFQRHSLGIGLKKDDFAKPNNEDGDEKLEVKEGDEEEEEQLSPPARPGVKVHLTPFELEGLWQLLHKLEELPTHKKCVPAGIRNAPALLCDIRTLLEEHANDDPKLSYTGKPIVTWPKRPSWYMPLPPPPSAMYRPRASGSAPTIAPVPRPTKPASSISALRKRRVRCKRCKACRRSECGDCPYCRDMKKFGGPGRLKKSCILRQCLAPALPLTAVCAICKEGSQEDSEGTQTTQTLMECSECGQITHRECITVPGEGVINNDLPSCWECPKCVQDKNTESSSSNSEEEYKSTVTTSSPTSGPPAKRAYREGIGVSALRLGRRGQPSPSPSSLPLTRSRRQPPPSQRILLQHQQSRKRAGALERQHRKRVKLERNKLFQSTRPSVSVSPKLLRQRSLQRGSMIRAGLGRGMSRRRVVPSYQGREVRLRSEASGGALRGRTEREEDGDDHDKEEENVKTERRENGLGGKENRPQRYGGRPTEEENREAQQNEERETEAEEDGEQTRSDSAVPGDETRDQRSCVTVTLQPSRGRRDPSTIVPKLEANVSSVSHTQSNNDFQGKSLLRPPLRGDSRRVDKTQSHSNSHVTRSQLQSPTLTRGASKHANVSQSLSSSSRESHHNTTRERNGKNVRPERGKPPATTSFTSPEQNGTSEPGWGRLVWVSVFRYLTRTELCVCMAVCKSWYKWGCDKRLWTHISLSRCQSISPQALSGIIKRQPVTLDMSWAKISKKQLTWLINRLPGLKDLVLSGCNWTSVSALSSPSCPLLRSLDLRWADGVKDAQIRELLSPPGSNNRSQLRNMQCLRLCGLEVTEATLRLILRHMPQLTRLELSHCPLTDNALNLLTAVGSSTRNTLTHLNLAGCSRLTDHCLVYLQRLSCLSVLDLRSCKGISRQACEKFISELSVNALYCLSDDKLIQRIS
ncbi:lysine-specific demethylase 2A isoform X1 [Tachysurus fulvidraco]|uniref:lysine-specific demethylase 2A isoform X1 n=1 Tax=Tachysurus fulvidraco TaxID=1234273 RepID=UPI000F4FCCD6|nr:lysine-specific demethylase 2A isoform X1 [Tachysurus fulvidraco]XP_047658321.1 lysine-specific demethylase 2A isoform X1 [Tachysurus fulvidraco]XP_047658322.1 lysine-specific demethylase 2A isoform X1 [Tachysurus fulvidraco]